MTISVNNKWYTLRRLFKYSAWIIRPFERKIIKKYSKKSSHYSPVFILGLPRSGTTVLYQYLSDFFNVTYFNNLVNLGRENIHFALSISKRIFNNNPHYVYRSEFGDTSGGGLIAPSEAGPLWYKWFPKNVTDVTSDTLSWSKKENLSLTIYSILEKYQRPLLIKNLYMLQRLKVIKELFPDAKYIYMKRDPLYIAQSLYIARMKNVKNPSGEWWSVTFPGYESLLDMPLESQVAHQVKELDKRILDELKDVNEENVMQVSYEDINPEIFEEQFGNFIRAEKRRNFSPERINFKPNNTRQLDDRSFNKLQSELNRIFDT